MYHTQYNRVVLFDYLFEYQSTITKHLLFSGLITVTDTDFVTNIDAFSVGHSSAFVDPGSKRISASSDNDDVLVAAYSKGNKIVIVAHNQYKDGPSCKDVSFNVSGSIYVVHICKQASVTIVAR